MKRCKKDLAHRGKVVKDPDIDLPCAPGEVWTTSGIKEAWMCSHQKICMGCKRVLAREVMCPLNYHHLPQHRRRA